MSTHQAFLLGKWIKDAKSWGTGEEEKRLYEKNARDLVTLWGGKEAFLHDYASKQWAGLFKGFYKGRWEIFIDEVIDCIKQNKKCELDILDDKIKTWEWEWVNGTESYSDQPIGNPIQVSKIMYEKYANKLKGVYGIALK